MMKGKRWAVTAALTAMLFTLTACGGDSQREEIRVTEVVRSIFYAPQYVALQQGYFKEQGLDVKLDTAWGGDKAMTRLLAGQADVALIGAETTVFVKQQGNADTVVSFAQATQRDGTFLISRNKIEKFDWSMVKGKSILGSRKGSMPEMVGEYVYGKNGLKPFQDVDIIQNVSFDNLATAFAAGTGDFYQAFEPEASTLEKAGKGYIVASLGQDSGKLPYTVFMTKSSYLKSHPEQVQKFTNAVQKGQDFVHNATPEEIAKVITPFFPDIDADILVSVVKRYQEIDAWPSDTIIDQEEFDLMKGIMKEAGELKQDVPYIELVNTEYAEKAKP